MWINWPTLSTDWISNVTTDPTQTTALVVVDQPPEMTRDNVRRLMKHLDYVISKTLEPYLFEIPIAPNYLEITRDVSQGQKQ
jgi:hypothetical protein